MRKQEHLVLGSKGFLGSNMVKFLRKKGHIVSELENVDLRDYQQVKYALAGSDYVWHFAADMGGIGYFSKANYYPPLNNLQIDTNILKACEELKVKRLFYPSSACAYPLYSMNAGIPLTEDMLEWEASPDQMYGWEKLFITKLMKESPLDIRVGVLHTIYGPGQEYEGKKAKFPPQVAYKALQAQKTGKLEIWGNGQQTRTFLYVDDAIKMIYEVMMSKKYYGEVNIGSNKEVSVNKIVDLCCKILNIKPKIKRNLNKPVGPTRRLCSNMKFNKHYKTRAKVTLKTGFKNIINYIQNNGR